MAPSLRVAAEMRPYFVPGLDGGACHSLRPSPRLAEFSLATPSIPIVLTGPSGDARRQSGLHRNGRLRHAAFWEPSHVRNCAARARRQNSSERGSFLTLARRQTNGTRRVFRCERMHFRTTRWASTRIRETTHTAERDKRASDMLGRDRNCRKPPRAAPRNSAPRGLNNRMHSVSGRTRLRCTGNRNSRATQSKGAPRMSAGEARKFAGVLEL